MEKVRRLRAMGSLCRQQAAYNGMNKWKLLAEAEYWEHLAQLELSSCFRECNASSSDEIAPPQAPTEANDGPMEWGSCHETNFCRPRHDPETNAIND